MNSFTLNSTLITADDAAVAANVYGTLKHETIAIRGPDALHEFGPSQLHALAVHAANKYETACEMVKNANASIIEVQKITDKIPPSDRRTVCDDCHNLKAGLPKNVPADKFERFAKAQRQKKGSHKDWCPGKCEDPSTCNKPEEHPETEEGCWKKMYAQYQEELVAAKAAMVAAKRIYDFIVDYQKKITGTTAGKRIMLHQAMKNTNAYRPQALPPLPASLLAQAQGAPVIVAPAAAASPLTVRDYLARKVADNMSQGLTPLQLGQGDAARALPPTAPAPTINTPIPASANVQPLAPSATPTSQVLPEPVRGLGDQRTPQLGTLLERKPLPVDVCKSLSELHQLLLKRDTPSLSTVSSLDDTETALDKPKPNHNVLDLCDDTEQFFVDPKRRRTDDEVVVLGSSSTSSTSDRERETEELKQRVKALEADLERERKRARVESAMANPAALAKMLAALDN